MSAGGVFGLVMNLFIAGMLWTILGAAVERISAVFNATIQVLPTLQDAVDGFSMMQVVWGAIMIVIFLGLLLNYIIEESSRASREV